MGASEGMSHSFGTGRCHVRYPIPDGASPAPVRPHPNPPPRAGEGATLFRMMSECARWKRTKPLPPFTGEGRDGGERRHEPFAWNRALSRSNPGPNGSVTGAGLPPPQPSPARGGGSNPVSWNTETRAMGREKTPSPACEGGSNLVSHDVGMREMEKDEAPSPVHGGKPGWGERRREPFAWNRALSRSNPGPDGSVTGSGSPPLQPAPARGGGGNPVSRDMETRAMGREKTPSTGEGRDGGNLQVIDVPGKKRAGHGPALLQTSR